MTTRQIIVIVIAIFLSGGFWYAIQRFVEKRNQQLQNQEKLLMGLGYTQIMYFVKMYLAAGQITQQEYDELKEGLCEPYLELDGNRSINAYMNKLKTMIIEREDDET